MEFLKEQVDAGIKPQQNHFWGQEFADKKFAVMLEGSWLLGSFPKSERNALKEKVGLLPMFPTPTSNGNTTTMMGGWRLEHLHKISEQGFDMGINDTNGDQRF